MPLRILLVAAAAVLIASAASAQTPERTLDRAVAAYERVRTVRATFEQRITNTLLKSTVTSRGEMLQQRPGKVAVRFTDPAGDRIVADGRHIWIYLPSTTPGQVIKMPVGQSIAGTPDVTAQFLESPHARYAIADGGAGVVAGRGARALILTPKVEATVPFTKATIWVDDADGLVRQFETTDQSGLVRRVTITQLRINPRLDRAAFTFTPPRGVRVFEQPGAGS